MRGAIPVSLIVFMNVKYILHFQTTGMRRGIPVMVLIFKNKKTLLQINTSASVVPVALLPPALLVTGISTVVVGTISMDPVAEGNVGCAAAACAKTSEVGSSAKILGDVTTSSATPPTGFATGSGTTL